MIKKCVHQRDVEFAGTYQIIAKFADRQCPVISPCRDAVVDGRLRGAAYLRQTSRCESWRHSAADAVIDPAFARHASHPSQNARTSGGSAILTGRKSGSMSRSTPPVLRLATKFVTATSASAT